MIEHAADDRTLYRRSDYHEKLVLRRWQCRFSALSRLELTSQLNVAELIDNPDRGS
jgi:hypothetical protein